MQTITSLEMSNMSGIKHNLIKRFIFRNINSLTKIGDIKVTQIDNESAFILDKFQAFHITSLMWNTPKSIDLKIEILQMLKNETEKQELKGFKEIKEEKVKRTRTKKEKVEKADKE